MVGEVGMCRVIMGWWWWIVFFLLEVGDSEKEGGEIRRNEKVVYLRM